eukprot:scaffold649_cov347-Pavlova_lutheri.AAC.54
MDPATPSMPLHVGSLPLSIARRFPFPFPRSLASIAVGPFDAFISIASEPAGERENSTESLASLDEASVVHVHVFTAIHGRFPGELHMSCPSSSPVSFFVSVLGCAPFPLRPFPLRQPSDPLRHPFPTQVHFFESTWVLRGPSPAPV